MKELTTHEILARLRNGYDYTTGQIDEARLAACDLIELLEYETVQLPKLTISEALKQGFYIETRGGRDPKGLHYNEFVVVGECISGSVGGELMSWYNDGSYLVDEPNDLDLVIKRR